MKKLSALQNTSGFSLIEVMVVGGIMLTLGLGAATMMSQQNRQMKNSRTYANRDALVNAIDNEIRKPYTVINSWGGLVLDAAGKPLKPSAAPARADALDFSANNALLWDCYWPTGTNTCTVTVGANKWADFYLIPTTAPLLTRDNAMGGPRGSFALDAATGSFTQVAAQRPLPDATDASSVRYDTNGRKCTAGETVQVCPFILRTQFQAVCKDVVASCSPADVTAYNLRYVFHNLLSGQTTPQGTMPPMLDKTRQVQISRADIDKAISDPPQTCLQGEVQVSANGSGLVCARARGSDVSNCIEPRVLRVQLTGASSQLICEDPFPRNFGSSAIAAPSVAAASGGCVAPRVITGIAADGTPRCDYPLKSNNTTLSAANFNGQTATIGTCGTLNGVQLIIKSISADGSVVCTLPLENNGARNEPTTNGQSATMGQCQPGYVVSSVRADGTVTCAAPVRCTREPSGDVGIAGYTAVDGFGTPISKSCPTDYPYLTSYSLSSWWGGVQSHPRLTAFSLQSYSYGTAATPGSVTVRAVKETADPVTGRLDLVCCSGAVAVP